MRNRDKKGSGLQVKSIHDNKPKSSKVSTKSISDSEDKNPAAELDDKFIEEVKEIKFSEHKQIHPLLLFSDSDGHGQCYLGEFLKELSLLLEMQ